ncbi:MAG: 50S ribosomal protein L4 [Gammaproteobacteria bacterium]
MLIEAKKNPAESSQVFKSQFNEALIHQVLTTYMTNTRAGTKAQKTRAEVRGGGKKPWKQKGTGRARAGTIRSPIWRKGGVIFAAKPKDYDQKINRKMYRGAIKSILSELNRQGRMIFAESINLSSHKTKELIKVLEKYPYESLLIIAEPENKSLYMAAGNIPNVDVCSASQINPVNLIRNDKVIMTSESFELIRKHLEESK